MLATFRARAVDLRQFAADPAVAGSVRLPKTWTEGEFVRGFGRVQRRPQRSVPSQPVERAFVDFSRNLSFAPGADAEVSRVIRPFRAKGFHRRMWLGLDTPACLFDFDVSMPFDAPPPGRWHRRAKGPTDVPLSWLVSAANAFLDLPVTVGGVGRTWEFRPQDRLERAPHHLVEHFARSTTARGTEPQLVYAAGSVLAIQAVGVRPVLDIASQVDRYVVDRVEILSFRRKTAGRWGMRFYVLSTLDDSPSAIAALRELRIHILRLDSIAALLARLTNLVWGHPTARSPLAQDPDLLAFQHLRTAILNCVRVVSTARLESVGSVTSLLSGAFRAHEFLSDGSLEVLQQRLLFAADPELLGTLQDFFEEEQERRRVDALLQVSQDRSGVVNIFQRGSEMSNYDMRGANIGAAGDNATASGFVQHTGQRLTIGADSFDQFELVADLARLRNAIAASESTTETAHAIEALEHAEIAARGGDAGEATRSLGKVKKWVLRTAEATGVAVAAAAIKAALGL